MHSPVLLPASLGRFGTLRPLVSVTDGIQAVRRHPESLEVSTCGRDSTVTEAQVVLRRTAFVAMAFQSDHRDRKVRENRLQRLSVLRQSGPRIVTDTGLVVVKIDVGEFRLYPILERLGGDGRRREDWWRRRHDADARGDGSRAARTVRNEFIGRRLRRADFLFPVDRDRADCGDSYLRRIRSGPLERNRLAGLNHWWFNSDRGCGAWRCWARSFLYRRRRRRRRQRNLLATTGCEPNQGYSKKEHCDIASDSHDNLLVSRTVHSRRDGHYLPTPKRV